MVNTDFSDAAIFGAISEDRLVDEHEAAARLGLNVGTLRRWRWARKGLPWIKIGYSVRYSPADIAAFIAAGRHQPPAAGDAA